MLRPKSRGGIKLKSADPFEHPEIRPNYLSDPDDLRGTITALRLIQQIYSTPRMREILLKRLAPAQSVDLENDAQAEAFVRQSGSTMYHPVGTCAMGSQPDAVVDARLRVRGVAGLRVVDASIMPSIVSGNTNAPAVMIGEKGARMILDDARIAALPPVRGLQAI